LDGGGTPLESAIFRWGKERCFIGGKKEKLK